MVMLGTHLFSVCGKSQIEPLEAYGISVLDPEGGVLYEQMKNDLDGCHRRHTLSLCSLKDLELPHASETQEIFAAAEELGAEPVPCNIALRILIEHPRMFSPTLWERICGMKLPFRSCILGVKPLTGPSGRQYVIELTAEHIFRFRAADPLVRWSDDEYWIFET